MIAHNATGGAPVLTGAMTAASVTIPAVAVTQADGNAIKAAIAAGPKSGNAAKHPSHPGIRDGDLENGIIAHEYAHGLSSRLTGGPGNSCLGGNEQAGEGWSDYIALTLLLDPSLDDPDQPRGMGPYALFQADRHGNGIRPRPYSRDMSIQPFTYDSIKSNGWLNGASLALPHGLGHGWASVLWDMNWDLIDKYGFNRNLYAAWNTGGNNRALQYVIDGLKLQGCNPGLVVARAAIIAARRDPQQRHRRHVHAVGDVRPPRPRLQRRPGDHEPQRQRRGVRHASGLSARVHGVAAEPAINDVAAGAPLPLTFHRRQRLPRARSGHQEQPVHAPGRLPDADRPSRRARPRSPRGRCRFPRSRRAAQPLSVDADGRLPLPVADRLPPGATPAASSC